MVLRMKLEIFGESPDSKYRNGDEIETIEINAPTQVFPSMMQTLSDRLPLIVKGMIEKFEKSNEESSKEN